MSLAKHLDRQRQALQRFVDLLEEERLTLGEGQIDGQRLEQLARAKQEMLALLEQLERQRSNGQRTLGYGEGSEGAERAAIDAGCQPQWQALIELAAHAKLQNRLNGDTIRIRLEHNQRMLNFLHEAAGKPLYGPDGQSRRRSLTGLSSSA